MSRKYSLYLTLGLAIIVTVTLIMSINAGYNYVHTKSKIIENMKEDSRTIVLSLQSNITNLIASYAINEYDKLIANEIKQRDIFAIIVEDYNMGRILGKKAYISGKLKDSNEQVIDYDIKDTAINKQLENIFYSDMFDIVLDGKKLGKISIYITDSTMNEELTNIIKTTLKHTIVISILLILSLFIVLRSFIFRPLANIIDEIQRSDKDGIPLGKIPQQSSLEMDSLSSSMNTMIDTLKASRSILKKNEEQLYKALELQTTIFDHSGYLMIRTNKKGLIKQVNKETERLLGYSAKELVDKQTPEILHLKPEVIKRAHEFQEQLNQNVKPSFETFVIKTNLGLKNEHEWTYITKEGKHIPVYLSVSALKNENNEIYGYIGIAQDITERKLIESQSKLASMGEMMGNIAHQWRQPLSVISTIASGLHLRSSVGDINANEIAQNMSNITQQTQYLSNTIDDFRNFIKNSNDKEKVSICGAIKKSLSILDSSLHNHGIEVKSDLEDDLTIDGFSNQLIQVFINIINNAKDAINEKELEKKVIFISTQKTPTGLLLTFKDNGGGVDDTIMSRIFEPYFTTKHKSVGTGIGLSMVYQILTEHHNASLNVVNETYTLDDTNCTGACFRIIFKA